MKCYLQEATVPHFDYFSTRKLITAMVLVENASKHYHVTTEIVKR